MKNVDEKLWALKYPPEGPLVPYLDAFAKSLDEQGFKRRVINPQIRLTAKFSKWLKNKSVAIEDINEKHVEGFFKNRQKHLSTRRGEFAALRRLLTFLDRLSIIHLSLEEHETTQLQQTVASFTDYLLNERDLSKKTLIQYGPFAERFLVGCFGEGSIDFQTLQAKDVVCFVKRQAAILSPSRAKSATNALRSFLRYLHYCGKIQIDLTAAVPTVPNWSLTGIPESITPEQIRIVLSACPRNTPVGRRDYAILLLLARLGLRAIEIVSLTLSSITWKAGTITVKGKGNKPGILPLPREVGEAIVDYLHYGRPDSNCKSLFLSACAPIRGLGASQTVTTIARTAIKRAGIETAHYGTHQFRHALASDMLRHGATMTEIGGVLRHSHIKTTSLYAKVDFSALRDLSLPWPGGVI